MTCLHIFARPPANSRGSEIGWEEEFLAAVEARQLALHVCFALAQCQRGLILLSPHHPLGASQGCKLGCYQPILSILAGNSFRDSLLAIRSFPFLFLFLFFFYNYATHGISSREATRLVQRERISALHEDKLLKAWQGLEEGRRTMQQTEFLSNNSLWVLHTGSGDDTCWNFRTFRVEDFYRP